MNVRSMSSSVELFAGGGASIDFGIANNEQQQHSVKHNPCALVVSGSLTIDVREDGEVVGARIEGAVIDIKAKSLKVQAIKDIMEQKESGHQINLGFSNLGVNLGGGISSGQLRWECCDLS